MKSSIIYFSLFIFMPFLVYSQKAEKVYAGIEIGVSSRNFFNQISDHIQNGDLLVFYENSTRLPYAIEYYKNKPVYLHLGIDATSQERVDKLIITVSPRLESYDYLKDMTQLQVDLGNSELLTHPDVHYYVFKKLLMKYGINYETVHSSINYTNGTKVPVKAEIWSTKTMRIELRDYGSGVAHRVVLVYTLKYQNQVNRF